MIGVNKDSIINKTLVGFELPKYSKILEFNKNKIEAFYVNIILQKLTIGTGKAKNIPEHNKNIMIVASIHVL